MNARFVRNFACGSLFLHAAFASSAWGQSACNDLSQPRCLEHALERADGQMNDQFKAVIGGMESPRARELRDSQRAWIVTRNRVCRLSAASTTGKEWLSNLVLDHDRALCVYGLTNSRVEELRALAGGTASDDSSLKEMNDYGLPLARSSGKGYAEVEIVAKGMTAENTRFLQIGAVSSSQEFIGMQIPGEDLALAAGESGIYVFGFAADFDNAKWYWSVNGKWQNGEPGSAQGASFKTGDPWLIRVMSPSRPIQVQLSRGGIVINTGKVPFHYATPAGYEPFRVPAKSAAGEAYVDWILPAYRNVEGFTLGQWAQRYWAWLLSKPAARSPVTDTTGDRCTDDQSGSVWFLAGADANSHIRRQCRVPRGRYLFLPVLAQLLTVQKEPGKTCADLEKNQIGRAGFNAQRNIFLKINGERFDSFFENRPYSTKCGPIVSASGQMIVDQSMFYGTFIMLHPLPPGDHVVEFGGLLPETGANRAVTYELHVE
jgi:uncharacterized protein YecT (DUF1311 family)